MAKQTALSNGNVGRGSNTSFDNQALNQISSLAHSFLGMQISFCSSFGFPGYVIRSPRNACAQPSAQTVIELRGELPRESPGRLPCCESPLCDEFVPFSIQRTTTCALPPTRSESILFPRPLPPVPRRFSACSSKGGAWSVSPDGKWMPFGQKPLPLPLPHTAASPPAGCLSCFSPHIWRSCFSPPAHSSPPAVLPSRRWTPSSLDGGWAG